MSFRDQSVGQVALVAPSAPLPAQARPLPPPALCAAPKAPSPTAPWRPPTVDAADLLAAPNGASILAAAIKAAPEGVLVLANALPAPFAAIAELFGRVTPERAARANGAYCAGSSRLVWKDAHGEGRGGPHVDFKRVIDLSPHRMESLASADPALASELGAPLEEALGFFGDARDTYGPLLLAALGEATGYPFAEAEARYAFRLVDYGARQLEAGVGAPPPRCGAHRDFGPATLIWPGGEGSDGLEIRVSGAWQRLPPLPPGSAVLLFGLCTAWRSNDRVPAAEHRACVLEPALAAAGEAPRYRTQRVGDVQPTVRRKWSWREGSVTAVEAAAEEEERAQYASQEELIAALYRL